MYYDKIGTKSNKVKNTVEHGRVKQFAESIRDLHPIYLDEDYGKKSKYGRNIAPPTFARVFDFGVIDELELPKKGLIHGEQKYDFTRPLFVGEEILCYTELKAYYEKSGNNGLMGFITIERYGEDLEGNLIFTEVMTAIITEAVRKAMNI